jgi:hypothetical protein
VLVEDPNLGKLSLQLSDGREHRRLVYIVH